MTGEKVSHAEECLSAAPTCASLLNDMARLDYPASQPNPISGVSPTDGKKVSSTPRGRDRENQPRYWGSQGFTDRRAVWLTWERHRRTTEIAKALSLPVIHDIDPAPRLRRYLKSGFRTASFLLRARPKFVVVQNPSLVLAWLTLLLRPIVKHKLILDNHNDGVRPCEALNFKFLKPLFACLHRKADLNIVTTPGLAREIEAHGGKACVLPDKVPDLSQAKDGTTVVWPSKSDYKVLFICSYAADEPVKQVIEAARLIEHTGIHIFITGAPPQSWPALYGPLPSNCHMLGFLTEAEFIGRVHTCDAIMDFTEMEDCLVCGAYEAVATGKPLLTSNTAALRNHFRKGTLYTRHHSHEIAAQMRALRECHFNLSEEMAELKAVLETEWQDSFQQFQRSLNSLGS